MIMKYKLLISLLMFIVLGLTNLIFVSPAFAILPRDPVGWWKMDENTGTTINDSSGNGFTSSAFANNTAWAI